MHATRDPLLVMLRGKCGRARDAGRYALHVTGDAMWPRKIAAILTLLVIGCPSALAQKRSVPKASCEHPSAKRPPSFDERGIWIPRFSGGVLDGKTLTRPEAEYPRELIKRKVSGTVEVLVYVGQTGRVEFACDVKGPKVLQQSAVEAAYLVYFKPTLLTGKPVRVTGVLHYQFSPKKQ